MAWPPPFGAPVLPPSAVLLPPVALPAPQAGTAPLPAVVAMVMGAALILRLAYLARVQRQHQTSMPSERGSNALVGSVIALVALVPAAIGAPFGSTDRFDIREQSESADSIAEEISPLSRLDEWRGDGTPSTLFSVAPAVSGNSQDWRFVALTRYDGSAWMPSSDFRPVGEVLGKAGRTPSGGPQRRWWRLHRVVRFPASIHTVVRRLLSAPECNRPAHSRLDPRRPASLHDQR